jgi:hypothetical protein
LSAENLTDDLQNSDRFIDLTAETRILASTLWNNAKLFTPLAEQVHTAQPPDLRACQSKLQTVDNTSELSRAESGPFGVLAFEEAPDPVI